MKSLLKITNVVVLALLSISLISCSGGSSEPAKHATPDDAFKAVQTAAESEDWGTIVNTMTKDSQDQMAAGMVLMSSMMASFAEMGAKMAGDTPEAKKKAEESKKVAGELKAILEKHGVSEESTKGINMLSDPEAMTKLADKIKDKGALLTEVFSTLSKLDDKKAAEANPFKGSTLSDLKINGDSATAAFASKDGKTRPIEFKKENGGWLIHMPQPKK